MKSLGNEGVGVKGVFGRGGVWDTRAGVAWLAKREGVEWGAGVSFAKEVLKLALPPGTPIVAVASKPKEVRFLRAVGFTALEYKGEATRAMVRRT